MLSLRTALLSAVMVVMVLGLVGSVFAQETDTIYIANGVVARIRTPGPYESIYQRSAAIDQAIAEVISTQDTQNPQVRVAMKDGKWSVYSGPVRIISVYPEEAKANGISAKALAQIWAKNIKTRLPLTTPKSKLPPGAVLPEVEVHPLPPSSAAAPEAQPGEAVASGSMSRSAALLLTIDAFNVARALSEEDYLARRDEIARNLLKNLRPFMGGAAPVVEPTPAPVEPVTGREEVGPPAPAPVQESEPAAPVEEMEGEAEEPGEAVLPEVSVETIAIPPSQEGDPAYAKVPQKNRIKTKFALIQAPYLLLVASDPEAAASVSGLLKAARAARAAEKFDECESYLDHVIQLLGIQTGP